MPAPQPSARMRVYLSFDIEVWCEGWQALDQQFPAAFQRYVYGRSAAGAYALPKTLEILARHGLRGVFFVEPLFAARFGLPYLAEIVALIREAGQDLQLHLHPEWTDEIQPPPLPHIPGKRQHLCYYSREEQEALLALGSQLLQQAGAPRPSAFRAGSYAANADTFSALQANGILLDSSLNAAYAVSGEGLTQRFDQNRCLQIGAVQSTPVTVLRDGLGKLRPAQVNALSLGEMRQALLRAQALGQTDFVIVSHNFEMLQPGSSEPDWSVVRRFEGLCEFLASEQKRFEVTSFQPQSVAAADTPFTGLPSLPITATLGRYFEQLRRRL